MKNLLSVGVFIAGYVILSATFNAHYVIISAVLSVTCVVSFLLGHLDA